MKWTIVLVAAFTMFAGCCRTASSARSPDGESEVALQKFHDRFVAVHTIRDVSGYGQLHSESVVFWWPGEAPTTGRTALESKMRENWKDRTGLQLSLTLAERSIHGNRAYEFGRYTESWRDPKGNHVTEKGRYVLV